MELQGLMICGVNNGCDLKMKVSPRDRWVDSTRKFCICFSGKGIFYAADLIRPERGSREFPFRRSTERRMNRHKQTCECLPASRYLRRDQHHGGQRDGAAGSGRQLPDERHQRDGERGPGRAGQVQGSGRLLPHRAGGTLSGELGTTTRWKRK